ncbi:hypothetical protein OXYTRIMIC_209 [Oxytricha trifallax]|uniref:Uncharacterized protein n=1 Tax=Oxytricha trifallax TaxID=1172189 RepID=A0A073HZM3_9SPIT|nr:hypothetical protein OXYTRIMIC_209 [Oxytricha trifallax]
MAQEDLGNHICCKKLIRTRLFQKERFYKHTRNCILRPECRQYIGQVQRRVVETFQRLYKNQEESLSKYINSLFNDTLSKNRFSKRTLRIVDNARTIQQIKTNDSRLKKNWINLNHNNNKSYKQILRGIRLDSFKYTHNTQSQDNLNFDEIKEISEKLPATTTFLNETNPQVETSTKYPSIGDNEYNIEESLHMVKAPYRVIKDSSLYDREFVEIIQESNSLRSKILAIIETLKSKNKWTDHHEQW